MNRRAFLGTLAAALTGAVLDPERLLWVPGQRTIFLPAVEYFEAGFDGIVTPEWVMREAMRRLKQQLVFTNGVPRHLDAEVYSGGAVRIRAPQSYDAIGGRA